MGKKFIEAFRALTLGILIVLAFLHFRGMILSLRAIDVTKLTVIQLISYEWIVPFVSLFSFLSRRRQLNLAAAFPSWIGLGLTSLFLVALSLSAQSDKPSFQLLSIAGLVWSVSYAFWGKGVARLLWFPMSFLVFAIPITFYLGCIESISAPFADWLTRFGTSVELSCLAFFSNLLGLTGFHVQTETPSSGIRSLFAMAAITAAFAHSTVRTKRERWGLYVAAIPIAILANLIRSLFICLIAYKLDRTWAVVFYNYFSQYVTFFLELAMIFYIANLIVRISDRYKKPTAKEWLANLTERETLVGAPQIGLMKSVTIIFLVFILAVGAFFFSNGVKPADKKENGKAPTKTSRSR